jgi:predicted metal-binding protein
MKKDKKQKGKIETCPVCLMNYLRGQSHKCPPIAKTWDEHRQNLQVFGGSVLMIVRDDDGDGDRD